MVQAAPHPIPVSTGRGRGETIAKRAGHVTLSAARTNGSQAPEVEAYYLDGDPLSAAQDGGDRVIGAGLGGLIGGGFGGALMGGLLLDLPPAFGDRHALTPVGPEGQPASDASLLDLHGQAWLSSSLDAAYRATAN
jgi:hypothetical protein